MNSPLANRRSIASLAGSMPARLLIAIVFLLPLADRGSQPWPDGASVVSGTGAAAGWLSWHRGTRADHGGDAGIDTLDAEIEHNMRHSRLIDAIEVATRQLDLRLARFGRGSPEAALSYRRLASIYHDCGMYSTADQFARLALSVQWQRRCDGVQVARTLTELGSILKDRARFDEARAMYQQALQALARSRAPHDLELSSVLQGLGHLARREGHGDEAERLFRRALAIHRRVEQGSFELAEQETWFGWFLDQQGNRAEAEAHLRVALQLFRASPDAGAEDIGTAMNALAVSRMFQGDTAAAESLLQSDPRRRPGFEARRPVGFGLRRFGGEPWLAELKVSHGEMAFVPEFIDHLSDGVGEEFARLAFVECGGREPRLDTLRSSVLAQERRITSLARRGRDAPSRDIALREDAMIRLVHAEAELFPIEWSEVHSASVKRTAPELLRQVQSSLAPDEAVVGWMAVEWLRPAQRPAQPDGTYRSTEWAYVLRDRGPIHLVRLRAYRTLGDATRNRQRRGAYLDAILQANRWPERVSRDGRLDSLARRTYDDYFLPILRHLSGARSLAVVREYSNETLPVEAFVDRGGSYVGDRFTISYVPSLQVLSLLDQRRRPARSVRALALVVGDTRFDESTPKVASRVPAFPSGSEVGGPLAVAPIEGTVLRDALDGREEALRGLPGLPFAGYEVRRVASLIPESATRTGLDAAEGNIDRLASSGRLRIVHLATHVLSERYEAERSALVVSRGVTARTWQAAADRAPDCDGLITAREIELQWHLDDALVTMSGCQTLSQGATASGQVIGFFDALLRAGAVSMVASLWKVDDAATALLMGRFYEDLSGSYPDRRDEHTHEPMPAGEALREAKHWLREYTDGAGRRPFDHPAYWDAFVLIGDPGWRLSS